MASIAALALAVAPASANAVSPVLEFSSPGNSLPIPFEAEGGTVSARLGEFDRIVNCSDSEGEGEITGPRTTLSSYVFTGCVAQPISGGGVDLKCTSAGASEEEIRATTIAADLVYLDQAKHEAAMLLNPGGGIYMEFECGTNLIKASGPFLAPVSPVNKLADSFTAVLERDGNSQTIDEYEDLNGVKHQAIPTAVVNEEPPDTSGVALSFTIQPSVPLEIKAISAAEIEAEQREVEAAKKRQEDEATAKKRQADEAVARKRQEDEAIALAAKKHQEEVVAKARKQRTKALKQCKKVESKGKRVRCQKRANKKYSAQVANTTP
ncbi:MAG TPA: cell envelope integrity protein TolA [Solirubrobacterales bacterium]|nr:cell envelope integrity protein TolA [Solirubrobacterales bacterium]